MVTLSPWPSHFAMATKVVLGLSWILTVVAYAKGPNPIGSYYPPAQVRHWLPSAAMPNAPGPWASADDLAV